MAMCKKPGSKSLNVLTGASASAAFARECACNSRSLAAPQRRNHRFNPERDTAGLMNCCTTTSKSSSGSKSMRRNATAIVSSPGANFVLRLCGRCDKSCGV